MGICTSKVDRSQQYSDYIYDAERYNRNEDFRKSLAMCDEAISLNPRGEIAYIYRGIALRKLCKLEEGIASYKNALEINPNYIYATYCIAYANAKDNGNIESPEFLLVLDQVINFRAKTFDDYIAKSLAYECLGDIDKHIEMARSALKLKEDAITYYNLADTLCEQGKYVEAESAYRDSLKIKEDALTYYNLGHMLSEQGKYVEAESAYRDSLKIKEDAATYTNLGNVYKKLGDYTKAETSYNSALSMDESDPLTYAGLGQALYRRGDEQKAIETLNKAFEVYTDPSNQKHLSEANHKGLQEIFSHERAELLKKFEELSAIKIEPIDETHLDPVEKYYVKEFNQKAIAAEEAKKAVESKYVTQSFDQKQTLTISVADMQAMIQYCLPLMAEKKAIEQINAQKSTSYYHHGLVSTLTTAYTSSQITVSGDHAIDTSNIAVKAVATVAKVAPFGGAILAGAITGGYAAYKTSVVSKKACHIYNIASTPGECEELARHLSMKLTLHPKKLYEINHVHEYKESSGIFSGLVSTLEGFVGGISTKIHGKIFDHKESELGRDDALKILVAIEEGKIGRDFGDTEDILIGQFCSCVLGDAWG